MSVQVKLLGGFGVARDDVPVAAEVWGRRQAAQLVQFLALSRGRQLHREQVIDALWPGLSSDAAAPRLHKAAHYARRALDDPDAVVLRQDLVGLFPGRDDVEVDVGEFTRVARRALRAGDATLAAEALEWYGGPLLPEDPYAPWIDEPRRVAHQQHLDLLRLLGRWDDVLAEEPTDEEAHLAVARARAAGGDVRGALVQLERLEQALRGELGAAPGPEAVRLRRELEQSADAARGRPAVGTPRRPGRLLASSGGAAWGSGSRHPSRRGHGAWRDRAGRGSDRGGEVGGPRPDRRTGSPQGMEGGARGRLVGGGPWPYSPVLEALSALVADTRRCWMAWLTTTAPSSSRR